MGGGTVPEGVREGTGRTWLRVGEGLTRRTEGVTDAVDIRLSVTGGGLKLVRVADGGWVGLARLGVQAVPAQPGSCNALFWQALSAAMTQMKQPVERRNDRSRTRVACAP